MDPFIGIDLGTTNSVVARINEHGRPEVVPNREGAPLTPSIIYFGVDPPAVGIEAREYARLGDEQVASQFKPQMGNAHFALRFGGRDYDATELASLILAKLKSDAEAHLRQAIPRSVITVPAYFGEAQRTATIEAGRRAGLEVSRIVHEPTAAALAYGLHRATEGETVLVYDLGGGTFDVTVVRIEPDLISVLSTAGDHDLGGRNWDDRIASWLAERFAAETGMDPLDDPANTSDLLVKSEQAKWVLSDRQSTRVTLQFGPHRKSYELARADFESMSEPLMERTRRITEETLDAASLDWRALSGVLLVGGSTRMPMVRDYVTIMAGKPPRAGVNVDEVVALGAAVQAALDAGTLADSAVPRMTLGGKTAAPKTFTLPGARAVRDVMSHSLGAVAVSPEGDRYVNDVVVGRNLPIPAENTRSYLHATHDGRNDRLEVYLTQGESPDPVDCTVLGKYVFHGITPSAAEVAVDVRVSYDANGTVQVEATQRDTGRGLPLTIEPVPEDLSWLAGPPGQSVEPSPPEPVRIYLLMDVSSSMSGPPLEEAQAAAREFLAQCDFTAAEVGLISFSTDVTLQAEATSNARKLQSAIARLDADGTTNLADALTLAHRCLASRDRTRYVVVLTDGFPDAAESAVEEAQRAIADQIQIIAIGTGEADRDYLSRIASTESGSLFARRGELVRTFGHIARVIAEGGRGLRVMS